MRTASLTAAALVAALGVADAAAQQAGTYRLTGNRVAAYNLAGRVTVQAGSGDAVVVTVTPAGPDAGQLEVQTGNVRDRNALRVIYPEDRVVYRDEAFGGETQLRVRPDGTFGGGDAGRSREVRISGRGSGLEAWADLTISIPAGRDVAVHQAVGAVTVRNVNGQLLVDTHAADVDVSGTNGELSVDVGSGDVRIRDVQGRLLVDTGSGNVDIEGTAGDEALFDTGSGNVRASGVRAGSLLVDTGSGDVTIDRVTAERVGLDTGSGSVTVGLDSDVSELLVDTGSGDVTIRAPATLGAQLRVDTGSGGIETDFPVAVTRRSRNELVGTLGDGDGRIEVETGSGSVTLLRR